MKEIYEFILKHSIPIGLFFLTGFFLSSFFTPLAIFIGNKFGIIDKPDKDGKRSKVHENSTPRTGGLAIYCSLLIIFLITHNFSLQFIGIIVGSTIIFLGMLIDDKKNLSVRMKFILQFIAAFVVVAFTNVKFVSITNPFNGKLISFGWLGFILTVIWIVGITNAINIIDGLDGLASGVSTISLIFLSIVAMYKGHLSLALMLIGISGALVAFLIYNFHPARIFLGDSGAELIGFLLAVISVVGAYKTATLISVAVPLFTLAIPIIEVFSSIIRRLINKSSPFRYDTQHFHYILLRNGWSQRKISIFYYVATFCLSFLGLFIAFGAK